MKKVFNIYRCNNIKVNKVYRKVYDECIAEFEESFNEITPFGWENLRREAHRIASEWAESEAYRLKRIIEKNVISDTKV